MKFGKCMICNKKKSEYKWTILEVCIDCLEIMRVREQIKREDRRVTEK